MNPEEKITGPLHPLPTMLLWLTFVKASPWRIWANLQSSLLLHRRTCHMHSLCWEFHQHTIIQCFVADHRLCFHTSNGELLENTWGEEGGGWYHGMKSLCTAGIVMTELFWSSGHVCTLSSARVQQLQVTTAVFANGGGEALQTHSSLVHFKNPSRG